MAEEPDMRFDVDALFDHMVNNLEHDMSQEKDWHFSLRSDDVQALEEVAGQLEDDFHVQLQEIVEEVDFNGDTSFGPPLLSIVRRAALTPADVKAIAERISSIASERGLVYEGVSCYDPIDEEELFGWIPPADAGWRLRHMTDCGLEENADLPWAFLILTRSVDSMKKIAADLTAVGLDDRDEFDEPDDEGDFGLCLFVMGRNNEQELDETVSEIERIAERHGGWLEGVQFYDREDVKEIFGGGESP